MATRRRNDGPRRGRQWYRDTDVITDFTLATGTQMRNPLEDQEVTGTERVEAGSTISRVLMDLQVTRTAGTTDPFPSIIGGLLVGPRTLDPEDIAPGSLGLTGISGYKWMWWRKLYVIKDGTPSTSLTWRTIYEIDVKSQRRINSTAETLFLAFGLPVGGADTYSLSYGISVLILGPAA